MVGQKCNDLSASDRGQIVRPNLLLLLEMFGERLVPTEKWSKEGEQVRIPQISVPSVGSAGETCLATHTFLIIRC